MKNSYGSSFLIFIATTLFISCESPAIPDQSVTIHGVPTLSVIKPNEVIGPFQLEILARDGLASFTIEINGAIVVQKSLSGQISYSAPFTYYVNHLDAGKSFQIDFSAIDIDGDFIKKSLYFSVYDERIRIDSDLTTDQTWTTGNTYVLDGRIVVRPGATLTIEKGVIVKAAEHFDSAIPSGLVISRGAKIIAEGTAAQPIIFTSINSAIGTSDENSFFKQNLTWDAGPLGNGKAPALNNFNWGGITIMGNARGSFASNATEINLSEHPKSEDLGTYGGTNLEDNSGVLKHLTIIGAGLQENEKYSIGAFTLAAVGSATTIENIKVKGSLNEGVKIKGGNVNLKNIEVISCKNGFDISQGWSGILENFIIIDFSNIGCVINGPEGSYFDKNHLLSKGLLYPCASKGFIYFDENSNTDMSKLFFWGGTNDFRINLYPKRFSPKISELMTPMEYEKLFPVEFHPFFLPFVQDSEAIGVDFSEFDSLTYKFTYPDYTFCGDWI